MTRLKNNNNKGFTLIEVLVALAILSGSFTVLFRMFNQSEFVNSKVVRVYQDKTDQRAIFNQMMSVNPIDSPKGSKILGDLNYSWVSKPIGPLLKMRTEDGKSVNYVQLYNLKISYSSKGRKAKEFAFDLMGTEVRVK